MKRAMTKATDISPAVRAAVVERDSIDGQPCCIISGLNYDLQVAHFIPKSQGGLGIVENLALMNKDIHAMYDNESDCRKDSKRKEIGKKFRAYLEQYYPGFQDEDRIYHKYPKEMQI